MLLDFLDDILPKDMNSSLKVFIHVLILIQVGAFLLYILILSINIFNAKTQQAPSNDSKEPVPGKTLSDPVPDKKEKEKKE